MKNILEVAKMKSLNPTWISDEKLSLGNNECDDKFNIKMKL